MGRILIDLSEANVKYQDELLYNDWDRHEEIPDDHYWRTVYDGYFLHAADHGHLARFEHDHPLIGKILEDYWHMHAVVQPPPPSLCTLPVVTSEPPTGRPGVASVAEPSGFVLIGLGLALTLIMAWGARWMDERPEA
jgi:hypothetical protein